MRTQILNRKLERRAINLENRSSRWKHVYHSLKDAADELIERMEHAVHVDAPEASEPEADEPAPKSKKTKK